MVKFTVSTFRDPKKGWSIMSKPNRPKLDAMGLTVLRDLLYTCADRTGASDEKCRGILLGAVCAIVALGNDFKATLELVESNIPEHHRGNLFPESWAEDFAGLGLASADRRKFEER
jgi:hypothetical protein